MKKGFWKKLKTIRQAEGKPIIALAPLADVTDAAFRRIIAKYSKPYGPDVMFTEFVSADGLFAGNKKAREILMKNLLFTDAERPIVAQFFTAKPDNMKKAAQLARELGFDGVDINMGCPDRSVEKQGAGAVLIKNPSLARALIEATKQGARDLPVSVKTRIGYSKNEIETWLPEILKEAPAAVTLHLRTRKEMSKTRARWTVMKRAVEIRDDLGSGTVLLGNGDVETTKDAKERAEETGADGVMIGRGIFGNPWLFSNLLTSDVNRLEKLRVLVEHTMLFEELLGDVKNFSVMKKHFKAYANGFSGAKELRVKLMEAKNAREVEIIVKNFKNI